jgi:hypothetical protein
LLRQKEISAFSFEKREARGEKLKVQSSRFKPEGKKN